MVGQGSAVLGPGFAPLASEIDDWNSDDAAFNGYFWSTADANNVPVSVPGELWLGHVISTGDYGVQRLWQTIAAPDVYPTSTLNHMMRRFTNVGGVRQYTNWTSVSPTGSVPIGGGSAGDDNPFTITTGGDIIGLTDADAFIAGGVGESIVEVNFTIKINNTLNVAGTRYKLRIYPTFNGAETFNVAAQDVFWEHFGTGTVGYQEMSTVSASWRVDFTGRAYGLYGLEMFGDITLGGTNLAADGAFGSVKLVI